MAPGRRKRSRNEGNAREGAAVPPGVSGRAAGGEMTADQRASALSRIRAHRNTIGEPFDPALEALFAEAPAAAAAEVTPGTRRSKRDQ